MNILKTVSAQLFDDSGRFEVYDTLFIPPKITRMPLFCLPVASVGQLTSGWVNP